jgi:Mn2+/Fe2+ NRAMP family transporter
MGEFVNRHVTTLVALVAVALILMFNSYLILTSFTGL